MWISVWFVSRQVICGALLVVTFGKPEMGTETSVCQSKVLFRHQVSESAACVFFSFQSSSHLLRVTGCWERIDGLKIWR